MFVTKVGLFQFKVGWFKIKAGTNLEPQNYMYLSAFGSCPKEHITALQMSIAESSCERLLLSKTCVKLQLHDAIYRLRFYSNSLIHILSHSNSHNNVASLQKNRGDKSHRVIVALSYNYMVRFIGYDSIQTR